MTSFLYNLQIAVGREVSLYNRSVRGLARTPRSLRTAPPASAVASYRKI